MKSQPKIHTDKCETENGCKGSVKDGVMTIWHMHIPKKEFSFTIAIGEIDRALSNYGNAHYAVWKVVERRIHEADERWIENTKDPVLRKMRRQIMDNDSLFGKFSALDSRRIDSACRMVKALYERETGKPPMSWLDKVKQV